MLDENGAWWVSVAPDGKENVTIGTPDFPVEMWGVRGTEKGYEQACWFVPWHWHPELEINLMTDGEEIIMADGKSVQLKPGQAIFVNGGVLHSSKSAPGFERTHHISLLFGPSVIGGASGSVFWQKYLSPLVMAPECRCVPLLGETEWERQVLEQIEHIAARWRTKQPGYEFGVREALSQIVFLLRENCVHHAPAPSERELRDAERIKAMVDFVRSHREEPITTKEIAASAAISVSECLRCFRRMMDLTPQEYLKQHRIRHAVTLLENTDLPIAQIGMECGFEDMSYFARVFRAQHGCTPSEYRAKVGK